MKKMLKNKKGFTLIELMIVVAIIGILAAIAIPNFMNYQCKAKQAEAKSSLGNMRTALEAYYAEYDTYTTDKDKIGFAPKGTTRYTYTISAGTTTFTATATAPNLKGDTDDIWTIDDNGNLKNDQNACSG